MNVFSLKHFDLWILALVVLLSVLSTEGGSAQRQCTVHADCNSKCQRIKNHFNQWPSKHPSQNPMCIQPVSDDYTAEDRVCRVKVKLGANYEGLACCSVHSDCHTANCEPHGCSGHCTPQGWCDKIKSQGWSHCKVGAGFCTY